MHPQHLRYNNCNCTQLSLTECRTSARTLYLTLTLKWLLFKPSSKHVSFPADTTVNDTWHLQEKQEFKLLTNFTIRLTNEMQALSRQSEPQQLVWSGWKEIIGGLISPIKGRNCWQSRRCRASFFWCIKSGCSLPRISSLSTVGTLKLSAFLSLRTPSPSLSLSLTLLLSFSHSLSLAEDDERLGCTQASLYTSNF